MAAPGGDPGSGRPCCGCENGAPWWCSQWCLKPLPEDKAEGSGRRSRRRSLGTLVSKKTEVEATEGEMVRKGKKGAAPPPPVKHSFEWE